MNDYVQLVKNKLLGLIDEIEQKTRIVCKKPWKRFFTYKGAWLCRNDKITSINGRKQPWE